MTTKKIVKKKAIAKPVVKKAKPVKKAATAKIKTKTAPPVKKKAVSKKAAPAPESVILEKPYTAPRFLVPDTDGRAITNKNLMGQWSVVYFYPKDMTPGCTIQAGDFERAAQKFKKLGAQVIGVSKDSCARHKKFSEKENLKFMLLSDEHSKMCESFGVWGEKSLYGRTYMGIERATFLVDPKGNIVAAWRKVKVGGHVDEVLATLEGLLK